MPKEIKTKRYKLYKGNCLKIMPKIKANSISLILNDPPYGTTACKWDSILDLEKMWSCYKHLVKDEKTPIILFSNIQFAVELISSNRSWFKYEWIWRKSRTGSPFCAKVMPHRIHEYILVFCKTSANYYPIMTEGEPYTRRKMERTGSNNHMFGIKYNGGVVNEGTRYPITIQEFGQNWRRQEQYHPTQKPVPLLEYLVKTYSKPNDIVLDNTMGSGTTGVACLNTGRRFIGIEKDKEYFNIACKRLAKTVPPLLA